MASRELAATRLTREKLERHRWRPGRRERLSNAVERESELQRRVQALGREIAEERHAERRVVDERSVEQRGADQYDRLLERRIQRTQGRGLER